MNTESIFEAAAEATPSAGAVGRVPGAGPGAHPGGGTGDSSRGRVPGAGPGTHPGGGTRGRDRGRDRAVESSGGTEGDILVNVHDSHLREGYFTDRRTHRGRTSMSNEEEEVFPPAEEDEMKGPSSASR
ncbi:hypothetical protein EYF80_048645 [Liparis tanakae]|uniref:Uncharacterized protein n=1 Tax=Liparis tanakae TaxID=230148 RepID=A0A4Z2FJN3_9TELE|nr:hypothetical protein EYF80_048645 [Liparis tanakae]